MIKDKSAVSDREIRYAFSQAVGRVNDRHEQREPAATEQRIQTEPNGWLPSAQCRGWPRENGLDAAKSSLSLMKGLSMLI
jgi:hypothetical protein